jgi:hypothetical protein
VASWRERTTAATSTLEFTPLVGKLDSNLNLHLLLKINSSIEIGDPGTKSQDIPYFLLLPETGLTK